MAHAGDQSLNDFWNVHIPEQLADSLYLVCESSTQVYRMLGEPSVKLKPPTDDVDYASLMVFSRGIWDHMRKLAEACETMEKADREATIQILRDGFGALWMSTQYRVLVLGARPGNTPYLKKCKEIEGKGKDINQLKSFAGSCQVKYSSPHLDLPRIILRLEHKSL
jgi:hypothetical protein